SRPLRCLALRRGSRRGGLRAWWPVGSMLPPTGLKRRCYGTRNVKPASANAPPLRVTTSNATVPHTGPANADGGITEAITSCDAASAAVARATAFVAVAPTAGLTVTQ